MAINTLIHRLERGCQGLQEELNENNYWTILLVGGIANVYLQLGTARNFLVHDAISPGIVPIRGLRLWLSISLLDYRSLLPGQQKISDRVTPSVTTPLFAWVSFANFCEAMETLKHEARGKSTLSGLKR